MAIFPFEASLGVWVHWVWHWAGWQSSATFFRATQAYALGALDVLGLAVALSSYIFLFLKKVDSYPVHPVHPCQYIEVIVENAALDVPNTEMPSSAPSAQTRKAVRCAVSKRRSENPIRIAPAIRLSAPHAPSCFGQPPL